MPDFITKMINSLKDPSRSFKERVFIMLTLITDVMGFVALIGDIFIGENIVEIITLFFTVTSVPIITLVSVKKNNTFLATRLIVIGVVFGLLPVIFFFGGGVEGGGVLWIIFAYLYTGLVLSDKWRFVMLAVLTAEAFAFYFCESFYPQYIVKHSRGVFLRDSLLSIILVGTVCCLMVWFEEWLYSVENARAREEAEKYEELNRSQSRFFSSMSHEIRTPINTILGLNEIILRQEDASDEIKRDAVNIQGAGRMLLSLVNDILDVSKIEAGKMDIVPVDYSLSEMISEIVNMMWLPSEEKGLKLGIEIDPSLPSRLNGDDVRIRQILINLLNNAVKYTAEGSVTLHIEQEDIIEDRVKVMFSVTDTGMGIKQDALPYLFDAFLRVDEEKNATIEGTGLGLSIVKQLVDLMSGSITVNSVYGEGSTFIVSLWQKIADPKAVGEISIENPGVAGSKETYVAGFFAPEARILIVDDNEMNLEVEKRLIADTGIVIDTASSGQQALDMTMIERYDMILMDHLMPRMDGIECLQKIRKQTGGFNNHVPVIVLTANAGSENKRLYESSGFDGYLVKPITGRQLEQVLLAHLPESKINKFNDPDFFKEEMNTSMDYSRKINLVVTTSTMCDLPRDIFREYGIDTIPFRIHADDKVYYDNVEAGTDEIIRYLKAGMELRSEAPTVEEFERFFGRELKKAHQVLYIALMSAVSNEYERAREAARAYGNVTVFGSEFNACSMGIMVLIAHNMSTQGKNAWEIVQYLNSIKNRMRCSLITGDTEVLMQRGLISQGMHNLMKTLTIRPIIRIRNNTLKVDSICFGDMDICYEKYIKYALPRQANPDLDVVFVAYADLEEREKERIRAFILNRVKFKRVVFIQASAVNSLNCGLNSFGLMYIDKGEESYGLDELLSILDEDEIPGTEEDQAGEVDYENKPEDMDLTDDDMEINKDEAGEDETVEAVPAKAGEVSGKKWYDDIPGLDTRVGLENTGTEELYRSVLNMFYDSIEEKTAELVEAIEQEDWENYTIRVHALKSSARIVGAMGLGNSAEAVEKAAKASEYDFVRTHHEALIKEYGSYKEILSRVF
ncbi:MAG: DegV family EDD domain-containing protein [Lachnospiraceae bacterium]|nr:DegV family EDD domain-containing protein [Lachnospiraceae bacterium]